MSALKTKGRKASKPDRATCVVRWSMYVGKGEDLTDTMALTDDEWELLDRAIREKKSIYLDGNDMTCTIDASQIKLLTTVAIEATIVRRVIGRSVGNVDLLHNVRQAYGLEPK